MIGLYMDTSALQLLHRDLQGLALDIAGANRFRQPLLDSAVEILSPSIAQNFEVGGRPQSWESAESGTPYRKSHGGGGPLNVTGKLKRSATAAARFKVRNNQLTYGDFPQSTWYAVVHDNADISEKAHIPNRPFALIQKEDESEIAKIFMDWLEYKVNQHLRWYYHA